MKLLVVDDDRDLVDLLAFALGRAGFQVLPAFDATSALRLLKDESPELAVVDVNLGPRDGFELLHELRRQSLIPVIMLTARDSEDDKVKALEMGADDYLTKPFSHRELTARIGALLRRAGQNLPVPLPSNGVLTVGPITLDVTEHAATKDGNPLDLTVTEFRLLHYLMINAGSVVPLRSILRQVWGHNDASGGDVVRVTVYRLRRKLEESASLPRLLHTVPGVGVMLKQE